MFHVCRHSGRESCSICAGIHGRHRVPFIQAWWASCSMCAGIHGGHRVPCVQTFMVGIVFHLCRHSWWASRSICAGIHGGHRVLCAGIHGGHRVPFVVFHIECLHTSCSMCAGIHGWHRVPFVQGFMVGIVFHVCRHSWWASCSRSCPAPKSGRRLSSSPATCASFSATGRCASSSGWATSASHTSSRPTLGLNSYASTSLRSVP